jgi:hypothetical protein
MVHGAKRFAVNGRQITPTINKGYVKVTREWKAGDRIELELPMEPQRTIADPRVMANTGLTALKFGPLIYNVEAADKQSIDQKTGAAPLHMHWEPDLLGGTMVISGQWTDGSKLLAVPNYARMNRVGPPHAYPGDEDADSGPSSIGNATQKSHEPKKPSIESKVWV